MKKFFPLAIIAVLGVAVLASCEKKNYVCTCNYTDASGTRQQTSGIIYGNSREARKSCNDQGNKVSKVQSNLQCSISLK